MELARLIEKMYLGATVYRPRFKYSKSLDADRRAFNAYKYLNKNTSHNTKKMK